MDRIIIILLFLSVSVSAQTKSGLVNTQLRTGYGGGSIIGFTFSDPISSDIDVAFETQYVSRNNRHFVQEGVGASVGNDKVRLTTTLFWGIEINDKNEGLNNHGLAMSFNYNFWKRFGGEIRMEQSKTTNFYASLTYRIK